MVRYLNFTTSLDFSFLFLFCFYSLEVGGFGSVGCIAGVFF